MTPNEYTRAVCACLRHATPKEKQAVAQELQDHLADHADALAEAGWDPEEAQAHALAAMGEAQEVEIPYEPLTEENIAALCP